MKKLILGLITRSSAHLFAGVDCKVFQDKEMIDHHIESSSDVDMIAYWFSNDFAFLYSISDDQQSGRSSLQIGKRNIDGKFIVTSQIVAKDKLSTKLQLIDESTNVLIECEGERNNNKVKPIGQKYR